MKNNQACRNNVLDSISAWFNTATPKPTDKDICVQLGCHFEEFYEMFHVIPWYDGVRDNIKKNADIYKQCKNNFVIGYVGELSQSERIELLDALCDQIVTAVGVAELMGMDIHGALYEVNRSNYSKFENGKAVRDEFGKIAKGKDYFKADLEKFV